MRSSRRIVGIAVLLVAAGCASTPAPEAGPFGGPEVASFDLSCATCMALYPEFCKSPAGLPVAAMVTGVKVLDSAADCLRSEDHFGASQPCRAQSVLSFASMRFLRNAGQASTTDTFLGHHRYELLLPAEKEGVVLEPDKTYIIFAGRPGSPREPVGDWYISIACEVPAASENERE